MLQQQQQAPRRAARCAAVSQLPVSPTHGSTPTHLSSTATADSRPSSAARISGVTPDGSDAFTSAPCQPSAVTSPPWPASRRSADADAPAPPGPPPPASRQRRTPSAAVEAERSRRVSPCRHTWPGACG